MKYSKSMKLGLWDSFFFSIMVGVGEFYLPAFALSIGMTGVLAGYFSTIPLIGGAVIQLCTPWLIRRFGSVQKWVVGAAFLQALTFVPLLFWSKQESNSFVLMFVIAAIYWGAGFAAGPSWNYWMGHLVSQNISTSYFAKRARYGHIGIFVGLVGGGYALHHSVQFGSLTSVFSLLFLIAFIARASSSAILLAKDYKTTWSDPLRTLVFSEGISRFILNPKYRMFFGFLFLLTVSVSISSPFVNPFLLKQIKLNYDQYMVTLVALLLAKIAALPFVNFLVKRIGINHVFLIGAIGISPLPALWYVDQSYHFSILLQAVSGFFWGFYEVALTVIFFSQLKPLEKIPILTLFNFFNCLAIIIGSVLGGQILSLTEESWQGYWQVFVGGAAARTVISISFAFYIWPQKDFFGQDQEKAMLK